MIKRRAAALAIAAAVIVVAAATVFGAVTLLQSKPSAPADGLDTSAVITTDNRSFGLPFAPGTDEKIGSNGLHDDNFGPVGGYTLVGAKTTSSRPRSVRQLLL